MIKRTKTKIYPPYGSSMKTLFRKLIRSGKGIHKLYRSAVILLFIFSSLLYVSCEKNYDTLFVVSSSPANHSTGVAPDFYAEVSFSNIVNRADVENSFSIGGTSSITGTIEWLSGSQFRFIPSNPVTKTGRYIMQMSRAVRDIDGNIMDTDFISDFYIGDDFIPPSVLSSDPPFTVGAAVNIPLDLNITVNFSKSMNRESVEKAFSITPDVPGYFTWSENVPGMTDSRLTFNLSSEMTYGKLYSFTVSKSGGDTTGNTLNSDYRVNFITGDDFIPPQVNGIYDASVVPGYWAAGTVNDDVTRDVKIAVDFSEAMDRTSVESAFTMTPAVSGNFEWSGDIRVVFTPSEPLEPEKNYQVYIDKTAKDINGLALESVYAVEIKTSSPGSLYLKCGNIWGSADGAAYTLLSAGIPSPAAWPLIIVMGGGTPVPQEYYIKIEFVSMLSPYTPVDVNKYSVIDNALIETFKSGPDGIGVASAKITGITWTDGRTVIFKFNPMTNKLLGHVPALYRLTLSGGTGGIRDINGNPAENDIVIEFREAL